MKLSDNEAATIVSCEMRAREPVSRISRTAGLPAHTLRYNLRALEERGVIRYMPLVNVFRLGYFRHTMYLSIPTYSEGLRDRLNQWLVLQPEVLWIGELEGELQLAIGICVRSSSQLRDFQYQFSLAFPNIVSQKLVASQLSATFLPHAYLSRGSATKRSIAIRSDVTPIEIDELDDRILQGLCETSHRSHRQLAFQLDIPLSTLELRIARLNEAKVIEGFLYRLFPDKLEVNAFITLLNTRGAGPEKLEKLLEFTTHERRIVMIIECLGAWDYEINIEVRGQAEAQDVLKGIKELLGDSLESARTIRRLRDHKDSLYPTRSALL